MKVIHIKKQKVKNSLEKTKTKKDQKNTRAKYPRHSIEKALRIPRAILDQNAGRSCTPQESASYVGIKFNKGPFMVEVGSAIKYGLLLKTEEGKLQLTDLAKRILRPKNSEDEIKGYQEAILKAPGISEVYNHYRGENIPEETFFRNTLTDTFNIPNSDFKDFTQIFFDSLEKAKLLTKQGDKFRIIDVTEETTPADEKSARFKKIAASVKVDASDSCFVMQPFAQPIGDYYDKIYKPAIEKAGLRSVRADADIFGTGKIIDQVYRGIKAAKVLVAELTSRNPNVFYELGLAHALEKPVVLVSSNEKDVPFDLHHIRVIYYDVSDPFWGTKLIEKVAENILSALKNPEEAIFNTLGDEVIK
jgi:hypothetical protein